MPAGRARGTRPLASTRDPDHDACGSSTGERSSGVPCIHRGMIAVIATVSQGRQGCWRVDACIPYHTRRRAPSAVPRIVAATGGQLDPRVHASAFTPSTPRRRLSMRLFRINYTHSAAAGGTSACGCRDVQTRVRLLLAGENS